MKILKVLALISIPALAVVGCNTVEKKAETPPVKVEQPKK